MHHATALLHQTFAGSRYEQGQIVTEVANLFQPYQSIGSLGTEIAMLISLHTHTEHDS